MTANTNAAMSQTIIWRILKYMESILCVGEGLESRGISAELSIEAGTIKQQVQGWSRNWPYRAFLD
jgi:hypothetical protein